MGMIDNLSSGQVKDIFRRLRNLETGSPMNNAAIGRGGIEVYDGGTINVSSGNLIVNGTATISGVLNADGTVTLSGVVNISGPFTVSGATTISGDTDITGDLTVTGPTHLNGTTDINGNLDVDGTLDINGVSTLNNDLNVQGGGKIKAGGLTLDPAASGGSVVFSGGGGLQGTSGVTAIRGAGNAGLITNTTASVFAAANSVDVSPSAVTINGPLKAPGITSTANAANVYFDPASKQLYYKP